MLKFFIYSSFLHYSVVVRERERELSLSLSLSLKRLSATMPKLENGEMVVVESFDDDDARE